MRKLKILRKYWENTKIDLKKALLIKKKCVVFSKKDISYKLKTRGSEKVPYSKGS